MDAITPEKKYMFRYNKAHDIATIHTQHNQRFVHFVSTKKDDKHSTEEKKFFSFGQKIEVGIVLALSRV